MCVRLSNADNITLEQRARRAARRVGCRAVKSRRHESIDNCGGFQLIDAKNWIVGGERFNLSAEDVLDVCDDLGA
jgi:hypothetical protein